MPVIVKNRPDGSKEIINSPSVIMKDPKTGKMKKAPTTRTIVPAPNSMDSVQAPVAAAIMPKGSDRGLVTPAPAIFDNPSLRGTNNQDAITGNIALLGTLLGKAMQFFTRSGTSKAAAPMLKDSSLRGVQQEVRTEDSLLPPELKKIVTETVAR